MKKLCIIFALFCVLPALAHSELPHQSINNRQKSTWRQRTATTVALGALFTCCPETSRQIIAYLLRK